MHDDDGDFFHPSEGTPGASHTPGVHLDLPTHDVLGRPLHPVQALAVRVPAKPELRRIVSTLRRQHRDEARQVQTLRERITKALRSSTFWAGVAAGAVLLAILAAITGNKRA